MAIKMRMRRKNNASAQLLETLLVAAPLLFFFFQLASVVISLPVVVHGHDEAVGQLQPVGVETHELIGVASMRRLLAPFQLCLACKCCVSAADPATCSSMPCCFGIDCQLPNKPYGVCAFVPKTCSCTDCAI